MKAGCLPECSIGVTRQVGVSCHARRGIFATLGTIFCLRYRVTHTKKILPFPKYRLWFCFSQHETSVKPDPFSMHSQNLKYVALQTLAGEKEKVRG